jgi:hypothetical protein
MIMLRRPIRSVNAPPMKLPMKLDPANRAKSAYLGHTDIELTGNIQGEEGEQQEAAQLVNEGDYYQSPKGFWIFSVNSFYFRKLILHRFFLSRTFRS